MVLQAHAAGFALVEVAPDRTGPALRGAVWYPCAAAPGVVRLGPMELRVTQDCPAPPDARPLIVMSHGSGGSGLGNHDTAAALADAGFVVAALNHPGDNFRDRAQQGELSIFASRESDMRRLIDHMAHGWGGGNRVDADRVGFFGFSRGGHTGLALAGAVADFGLPYPMCDAGAPMPMCQQMRRDPTAATVSQPDPRIKALVLVDPLPYFFSQQGLKPVRVPVQIWSSERGGDGLAPENVRQLARFLPVPPDLRVVAGAGHFAFLAPCPPALAAAEPIVCGDPHGFDRRGFHVAFNSAIVQFFRSALR